VSLELLLDLTLSKSKLEIAFAFSYAQLSESQKVVVLNCRDQPKYNQRVKAASVDGKGAYKCLDARDGSDCNQLRLYIDEYIAESIAISLDCISIGISSNQLQSDIDGHRRWFRWWVQR
jgi:hypothetical protein